MKFSLIICTYMRPNPLRKLLQSVKGQTIYPDEILIVDGSENQETKVMLEQNRFQHLHYFSVSEEDRGLTRQRNYGIARAGKKMDIVCFLDDDTVLEPDYFEQLLKTFEIHPDALGVGGYISNEVKWEKLMTDKCMKNNFCMDGFMRKEGIRIKIRKQLGLLDNTPPGFMPRYSHARAISYLPPSDKTYSVEFFMGGVSSFRKVLFTKIQFSTYFEGYGLYEDLDFCLRASKIGNLYVNTAAKLEHHHEEAGRPNEYRYGKMVVRNGYYVWRVKYSNPSFNDILLFHLNVLLLMKISFINGLFSSNKKQELTESIGRLAGWLSLFFNKPKIQ